jgi:DNA-binding beta-propeller fold protein YncE
LDHCVHSLPLGARAQVRAALLAALLPLGARAQVLPCVVTSLAGTSSPGATDGTGTSAKLITPWSFASASGGTYFTDFNRVRFIAGSTVTTIAGGTTLGNLAGAGTNALFRSPLYVAADPVSGSLYVSDTLNSRIRVISPSGVVSAFSGNGSSGSADGPPASSMFVAPHSLSLAGTVLAVADAGAHRIRSVSTITGDAGSLAGSASNNFGWVDGDAAAALFYAPRGVSWDLSGSLWIADTSSNRIRSLLPSGRVITVAGNAIRQWLDGRGTAASFNGPQGIAADPTTPNACFVFDTVNSVVRRIVSHRTQHLCASRSQRA